MLIKEMEVDKLIPYTRNPRNNKRAVAKVAASIKEYGFRQPIVVDGEMVVVAGHTRLAAAWSLGLGKVPVHIADNLTEAQIQAYRIMDNRSHEDAEWDDELLGIELADLEGQDFDLELTGFTTAEIDQLMNDKSLAGELEGEDDAPVLPAEPSSKRGEIYQLGEHRMMCGDSTSEEDVALLMNGQKADLVFTDPPYNVDYSGGRTDVDGVSKKRFPKVKNDNLGTKQFVEFLEKVFFNYFNFMKALGCLYVCHPDSHSAPKLAFETKFAQYFKKSSTIIWVKNSSGLGWGDYRAKHEPILYGWKPGDGRHSFYGDRTKTTVWNISKDAQVTYKHPTQKPVALVQEGILNSSKGDDIVMDLFGGSGSTLVAAEKLNRKCYMMELDPAYCDVIIERYEKLFERKAEKLNA